LEVKKQAESSKLKAKSFELCAFSFELSDDAADPYDSGFPGKNERYSDLLGHNSR
jgi:hypothetical protein